MSLSPRAGRLIAAPALLAALVLPSTASATSSGTSWDASAPGVCGTQDNTFTVPSDVTQIHVRVIGGDGQPNDVFPNAYSRAAAVDADVAVVPGQVLYACLDLGASAAGVAPGGFTRAGGAGGGYGSLANAADGSNPIIVAGGSGGSGGSGLFPGGANGAPGALPGDMPAHGGDSFNANANGGESGSGSAAGAGGLNSDSAMSNGVAGTAHQGGGGGASTSTGGSGGGGGGGYFGGGGGAGSRNGNEAGAGGGGGSSFCAITCTGAQRVSSSPKTAEVHISWSFDPAMTITGDGDFGDVKLGETATRTYTVKSTGTAPLTMHMFGVSGGDIDFGFGAFTCGNVLAIGDECTVDVKFTPTTAGTHTGTFTIAAADIADGTLALTANGVTPPSGPTDGGTGTTPPPTATPPAPQTITPTACVSRRVVDLKVPGIYRKSLVSAKAQIAGKTVANLKNGKGQIDLRGRTAGKVKVTLVIKLRGGRTRTDVRTYTTCGK